MLTKLIFGLHSTWKEATITITGRPVDPATALTVFKRDVSMPATVQWNATSGTWSIKVEDGDYLFRIDVPGKNEWWNGGLPIAVDQANITFVFHGPETEPPNDHQTLAWTAPTTASPEDPKDPWPPPAQVATTLPPESFAWHDDVLHEARINIVTPKGLDAVA